MLLAQRYHKERRKYDLSSENQLTEKNTQFVLERGKQKGRGKQIKGRCGKTGMIIYREVPMSLNMFRCWVSRVYYYFPHVACYPKSSIATSSFTTSVLRITWRPPLIQMKRNQKASQRTSPYQIGSSHPSGRLMLTSVFLQQTILRPIGQTWEMTQAAFRFPGRNIWAVTRIT